MAIDECRRREADIRRTEREALRAVRENEKFIKEKSRFFGLTISDGEIEVMVLDSVETFIEEGQVQHICVGTSMYYTKKDSLTLSAKIEGKRIETVEV